MFNPFKKPFPPEPKEVVSVVQPEPEYVPKTKLLPTCMEDAPTTKGKPHESPLKWKKHDKNDNSWIGYVVLPTSKGNRYHHLYRISLNDFARGNTGATLVRLSNDELIAELSMTETHYSVVSFDHIGNAYKRIALKDFKKTLEVDRQIVEATKGFKIDVK